MKLFRQLKRYFRDAFKSVFRNFPLSLASISCITITLIVVAASIIITYNVENFAESIRKDVTIVVFLEKKVTDKEIKQIEEFLNKFNLNLALDNSDSSAYEYEFDDDDI